MLERKRRITKNKYFQYIYKKGNKLNSSHVFLVYVPTKIKPSKFGFVVTNKIGKAVTRNLIKRRLRAIIGNNLDSFSQLYNYVITAKEGIDLITYDDLQKELLSLFRKGGLINDGDKTDI